MAFPEGFIQELKARNDITEIISSYVSLKRRGRNMVGLCPFHGEKTPSFNIYTETDSFYCFGCGAAGDVISFIMKIENLDYVEAVRYLAQRAGMEMPDDNYDNSMSNLRRQIYEANREAARFFYKTLMSPQGKPGLDYLHGRMLSDKTIRHFGLGFAPDSWTALSDRLRQKGFSENVLTSANLAVKRRSGNGVIDRFRNRVMFPIIDLRGNVIAFGGRIMTNEKPKYLNSSDTPVFKKSENLFSLNNAKNSGSRALLLCEGYMDVICYDADEAGQKATARAIPILRSAGLGVRVLSIPNGKDPDEFLKTKGADGPEAFRALIEKSGNDVEYRLQKLRSQYNLSLPEGRVSFLEAAARMIAEIDSPIERDVYTSRLSKEFEIDKNALLTQINSLNARARRDHRRREMRQMQSDLSGSKERTDAERGVTQRATAAEEGLVVYLINHPDSLSAIERELKPEQFTNPLIRRFYEYFSKRIADGLEPLNNITADFTAEEQARIYRMLHKHTAVAQTTRSLREYIGVITSESSKPEDKSAMSDDDINHYFARMRQDKK